MSSSVRSSSQEKVPPFQVNKRAEKIFYIKIAALLTAIAVTTLLLIAATVGISILAYQTTNLYLQFAAAMLATATTAGALTGILAIVSITATPIILMGC